MKKSEIKLKRLKTNAVIENGIQTELKKSEIKLQTCKKDSQTRLKKCEVILKKSDITEHDIFPRVENKHDKTTSILKNNCNSSEIKTKTSEIKLKTLKKNLNRIDTQITKRTTRSQNKKTSNLENSNESIYTDPVLSPTQSCRSQKGRLLKRNTRYNDMDWSK